MNTTPSRGFTIVELLIVIVVIGVLAAITIVAYNGVQDRAKQAKIAGDIKTIVTAIHAARQSTGKNLGNITNSYGTGGGCWSKPDGTDLATLPSTDGCMTTYKTALNAISSSSGAQLGDLRDPWGRPYLIDENEGEGSPTNCTKDTVAVYKLPYTTGFGTYTTTPRNNVPLAGFSGCS